MGTTNMPVATPESVAHLLDLTNPCDRATALSLINRVSAHFQVPVEILKGNKRTHEIVFPRQIACYLIRKHTKLSYPSIGRQLWKHHTAVIYAVQRIEQMRAVSPELDDLLKRLAASC